MNTADGKKDFTLNDYCKPFDRVIMDSYLYKYESGEYMVKKVLPICATYQDIEKLNEIGKLLIKFNKIMEYAPRPCLCRCLRRGRTSLGFRYKLLFGETLQLGISL